MSDALENTEITTAPSYRFFNPASTKLNINSVVGPKFQFIKGLGNHKILQEFDNENYRGDILQINSAINLTSTVIIKAFAECPQLIWANTRISDSMGRTSRNTLVVGKHLLMFVSGSGVGAVLNVVAYVSYPKDRDLASIREEEMTLWINKPLYNGYVLFSNAINRVMSTFKGEVKMVNDVLVKNLVAQVKVPNLPDVRALKAYREALLKNLIDEVKKDYF